MNVKQMSLSPPSLGVYVTCWPGVCIVIDTSYATDSRHCVGVQLRSYDKTGRADLMKLDQHTSAAASVVIAASIFSYQPHLPSAARLFHPDHSPTYLPCAKRTPP